MDVQWYYSEGGQRRGPVPADQLKNLTVSGTVKPDTLVWKQGMAQWTPAGQVAELQQQEPPPLPGELPPIPGSPIVQEAPQPSKALTEHVFRNGVCARCGCSETYIAGMAKHRCEGGIENPSPSPGATPAQPKASKGRSNIFRFGGVGVLFGIFQMLFINLERGIFIAIVGGIIMLVGIGMNASEK